MNTTTTKAFFIFMIFAECDWAIDATNSVDNVGSGHYRDGSSELVMADRTNTTSMEMKRGPVCQLIRQPDSLDPNMVHLYLTPPKITQNYKSGKIRLYLTTSMGTLNVPLALDMLKDGQLYVRFYLKRLEQDLYYINVEDEQEPENLLLYSGRLVGVPLNMKP